MSIGENALSAFLNEKVLEADNVVSADSFLNSRLFGKILRGEAKLSIDRVEQVATDLDCDVRQLFRLAVHQFFDLGTVALFEKVFADPVTESEKGWLDIMRASSLGPVPAPSNVARRVVRALLTTPS